MKEEIKEGKIKRRILKQIGENKNSIKELIKQIRKKLRELKKALGKEDIKSILDANSSAIDIMMDAETIAELTSEIWVFKKILEDKFWEDKRK